MHSIYFDLNIPKFLLTKALSKIWKNVFYSFLSPISFADLKNESLPGSKWVRVKNHLSGICGSDLSLFFLEANPKISLAALPGLLRVFLGHEICGEIVETGNDVASLKVNDRVIFQKMLPNCFNKEIQPRCVHCQAGNYAICENQSEGTLPTNTGGGWSESFNTHESQLVKIPEEISDEQAVLIEPIAVAVRAVLRKLPQPNDKMLIIGAGIIGLLTLHFIKVLQPECQVSIIARHEFQQKKAEQFGADNILSGKNLYQQIAKMTNAHYYKGIFNNQTLLGGFDKIFDCVAKANTIQNSLRWCKAGGTVILVGVDYNPGKFDYTPIVFQEINLIASFCHGMENFNGEQISTFDLVIKLLKENKLQLDNLITHRFQLKNHKKALKIVTNKKQNQVISGF